MSDPRNEDRSKVFQGYLTLGSLINLMAIIGATVGATLYVSGIKAQVDLLQYQVAMMQSDLNSVKAIVMQTRQ